MRGDKPGTGSESGSRGGITRRDLLKTGAAVGVAGAVLGPAGAAAAASSAADVDLSGPPDLILDGGRIHTFDGAGTVASSIALKNGYIVDVGRDGRGGAGTRRVNLRGATVVPGIIDNHNHIVLMGNRPGYHTPLENAYSVADIQDTFAARAASLPAGEWITTIGGFHRNQFAEVRLPTLAELDAAIPDHPAYISEGFSGPSTTNSAGKAVFEANGVTVGANGSIAAGFGDSPTGRATLYLRRTLLTPETRRRGAVDAMEYAVGLGVTTHLDQGAFQKDDLPSDGAASEDNFTMHIPFLEVFAEGGGIVRLRINFLHRDAGADLPTLTQRLRNQFPFFGNDMIKTGGIGEFVSLNVDAAFVEACRKVAEAGWRAEVHSLSASDFMGEIQAFEAANAEFPITDLRWVVAHVPFITEEYVNRLKALGGGLSLTGWRYLAGSAAQNGPPFRMIVDNGINVGLSSDGMQIAPMNPWLHMYYATTGKNALGTVINGAQTISREEALSLYTRQNGWFIGEEDLMGTLEVGKFADLVVLNKDYFTVPDEELKEIRSVLTVVDGKVVHEA